jgi:hypothetical protein
MNGFGYGAMVLIRRKCFRCCLTVTLTVLGFPGSVAARPAMTPQCGQATDYKVASPNLILLYCADGIPPDANALKFTIFSLGPTAIQQLPTQITWEKFSTDDKSWIVLQLGDANTKVAILQGGKKYRLVYRPPTAAEDKTVDIDTSASVPITLSLIDTDQKIFDVKSHVAFQAPLAGSLKLTLHQYVNESREVSFTPSVTGFLPLNASKTDISDPGDLGRIRITLDEGITGPQQISLELQGLVDIFNQKVKVDPSARIKLSKAPATREAAYYYFKVDYAAGVGAKPAWVFDGKVAPPIGSLVAGWQFAPDLEADIGNSSISGIKYTDIIHLGVTASRGRRVNDILEYVLTTIGPTYETDKEFNRENLLGTVDFAFNFKNLYEPRKYRTIDKFKKIKDDPKNATAKVQIEDIKPALFGYGLDFHAGVEGGGALVDTTQKATTGSATITVPTYSIFRPYPEIHAFLEVGTVTFDVKVIGRNLVETENTVRQLSNGSLLLRPLNGWQAYAEGNITWTLDPSGHFAANIVYKNGFSPPLFNRVNTVQAGLLIKF